MAREGASGTGPTQSGICGGAGGLRDGFRTPGARMRLDHFTVKSQEALERAQRLARERGHQELAPDHLLAALLEDREGISNALLQKLGVQAEALSAALE